jgi:glycosyltransferase involved in cell wall biosynthesis
VTVIIPVRNCVRLIDQQLDALAKQTYRGEYYVIVSDNGSTDGLKYHIDNHILADVLAMEYLDASRIRGAAHARNVGASVARGDFLAFCDADDRVSPAWLDRLVQVAKAVDIVGTNGELKSLNERNKGGNLAMPGEGGWQWLPFACAGSFGVWRDVYAELGGMDETFPAAEDCEFSYRAQSRGFTLTIIQEPLFAYRMRESVRSNFRRGKVIGYNYARVAAKYAAAGHPPDRIIHLFADYVALAIFSPIFPIPKNRSSIWEWAGSLGHVIGKTRGVVNLTLFDT